MQIYANVRIYGMKSSAQHGHVNKNRFGVDSNCEIRTDFRVHS